MNAELAKRKLHELQQRLKIRHALAIQVKSDGLAVSLVRWEMESSRLVRTFVLPFGADAVQSNPDKVGNELGARLRAEGIREKRCIVCVPPGWALTASADVPEISDEDLPGYLELCAEREFPIPLGELRLSHCSYGLPDGQRRATIAAVSARRLAAIEQMITAAGCKAMSISLGLDRFVPLKPSTAAVHFLANGNHVDLIVSAGGGIAALRSLAGSVAQEDVPFDTAGFCREVRITLGGLPDPLRQLVREAHFGGPPATAELLSQKTANHLLRMGVTPGSTDVGLDGGGSAFEAATQFLQDRRVAFEFLPPQVNRWQVMAQRFDSRSRRWFLAGGVGLLLLPIVAFWVRGHILGNLQRDWDGMKRNVGELDDLQGRIRTYRPWFDPAPELLPVIEGLAGAFPERGDTWCKSVSVSDGTRVTLSGFARNQSAFLTLHDRLKAKPGISNVEIQQTRGDNPVQYSITFKWEAPHGN